MLHTDETKSLLSRRTTRRQIIKAGGIAALGLLYVAPVIETVHVRPVFAQLSPPHLPPTDCEIFREDGEGFPEGAHPDGWDGNSGQIWVTTSVKQVGNASIAVSYDNYLHKDLPCSFVGWVSVSLWMFPTPDHNTNNVFFLGHSDTNRQTFGVRINETDQWFIAAGAPEAIAPYSGTWTFVEMEIDTISGKLDISLDGTQVVNNAPVSLPKGINAISVLSGRGGAGHTSYFDELIIKNV